MGFLLGPFREVPGAWGLVCFLDSNVTVSQICYCSESKEADQVSAEASEVGKVSSSWGTGLRRGAKPGKENSKNSVNEHCLFFQRSEKEAVGKV